jgi:beta-glucosidase
MKVLPLGFLLLTAPFALAAADASKPRYLDPTAPLEERVADLLPRLTLEEKVAMLGGDETGFNGCGVARLGIPPIRMSDGPVGVRTGESTAFPVSVNLAASWDLDLARQFGIALGEETKAKGKNCILGPCVGIHRFPLNGRNFESLGEDPFLAARMAVNVIRGVQSQNVIATVKHFACNDQEWERDHYDVQVDERTLREIHLPAFEAAVQEGGVWALMSAYNLVNGQHCSENRHLLTDILKGDWGYQGLVMSDWVSVYSADHAANNGLDLEMPNPVWFKEQLFAAIHDGRVSAAVIDDKVRRHLRVRFAAGLFETPAPIADDSVIRSDAHRKVALTLAQHSLVLLKNDGVLPLTPTRLKTVAVIGPSAKSARTGGGGSSTIDPWIQVSPFDGLAAVLGTGVKLEFSEGVRLDPVPLQPVPAAHLRTPDGQSAGLLGEYFANESFEGPPAFTRVDPQIDFNYHLGSPDPRLPGNHFSIRWTGKFVPPVTQRYRLTVASDDGTRFYLDGKMLIDNWGQHGELEKSCTIELRAGHAYDVRIDYNEVIGDASVHFGWVDPASKAIQPSIAAAAEVARRADVAVVCVGNTAVLESEGADVADFKLFDEQDALVQAVVRANPNTIVVVYGGVPVQMKTWLTQTRAVIAAFYPGQEGGTALAQTLTGVVNPSGKLPFSYIQERSESPAFNGYMDPGLKVNYAEGVFVGYRYYDAHHVAPLFPFGFGLSYTTFAYNHLQVAKVGETGATLTFEITNTGRVAGEEVAQVYVGPRNPSVPRPVKELKGFAKVALAPGETKAVSVALDARAFQFFHPTTHQWTLEPGAFDLLIGASSRDIKLKDTVTIGR